MKKSVLLTDIIHFLGNEILNVHGNPEGIEIHYLNDPQRVDKFTLDWINPIMPDKQKMAVESKASAIIVDPGIKYDEQIKMHQKVLIIVENPKHVIAKIGNNFFVEKLRPGIHPTAIVHPEAIIGEGVYIGANVVIKKSTIGDNTFIYDNVVVYDQCVIGNNVSIHSGAVVGVDGLGCIRLKSGELYEFPQLGGVIIDDNVYIGANTQIACGALSNTIIGKGSKINGLCFIGSNCILGKNIWITGSSMIAGSVTIGNSTTIYSKVVLREHIKVGSNVIIGMGSVVTKSIPNNETWFGNPAKSQNK